MLVLSRKEGERLVIGENIVITVNRISGNRITLGIDAPRDVRIVRGELEPKDDVGTKAGVAGLRDDRCNDDRCNEDRCNVAFEIEMAGMESRAAG